MAIVLGFDAILMRGTAGVTAATKVTNVRDLTLNLKSSEADVTLTEASLEFGILYDTEDADFTAFRDACFGNTPLALFVTDGNGSGLDADWSITRFSIEQPLEEALTVSVTAKPTASTRAPSWVQETQNSI